MIPVSWLAPRGHWDQNLLTQLFENKLYPTGLHYSHHDGWAEGSGAITVIPGRYWASQVDDLQDGLARYDWVLAIRTSDEEDWLQPAAISHPNIAWWVQTPRTDRDYGDAYLFGVGFPPHFNRLGDTPPDKQLDVFLAAQNTHDRRHECFEQAGNLPADIVSFITATPGFTQGEPPDRYANQMRIAKIAPCPAGPVTPDTFRTYEALAAHTIPIADDITPGYDSAGYWRMLYPDTPMPVIENYGSLPSYIDDLLHDYPRHANRVTAWWVREKRRMARRLRADLQQVGAL